MERMNEKIKIYEQNNMEELSKLRQGLDKIRTDRADQVVQFQARFRELRGSAKAIIKKVKQYDHNYDQLVTGFFTAIDRIETLNDHTGIDDETKIDTPTFKNILSKRMRK
jgi:hypothetical protein